MAANDAGEELTGDPEARADQIRLIRELSRSLVCLSGAYTLLNETGRPEGDVCFFACTCFAMSFGGVPVLVTAGHVLQDVLEPLFCSKQAKLIECNLCDFFGPKTDKVVRPMPFDYQGTPKVFRDEEDIGLDFGLLFPRPFYWESMRANGVQPIPESLWVQGKEEQFDLYKMVGFPTEWWEGPLARHAVISIHPVYDTSGTATKERPWFVGQLGPTTGLTSIKGVSGGPIFGFRKVRKDVWDYRVVAMQSRWNKTERVVYGTPLRLFAPIVRALIDRFLPKEQR